MLIDDKKLMRPRAVHFNGQSNISKRVGEGVITICVVLDQSTVIFF
jgi:hypothetical protein